MLHLKKNCKLSHFTIDANSVCIRQGNRHHDKNRKDEQAVLINGDEAVKIFAKYGWGGLRNGVKDYQHFYKLEK